MTGDEVYGTEAWPADVDAPADGTATYRLDRYFTPAGARLVAAALLAQAVIVPVEQVMCGHDDRSVVCGVHPVRGATCADCVDICWAVHTLVEQVTCGCCRTLGEPRLLVVEQPGGFHVALPVCRECMVGGRDGRSA